MGSNRSSVASISMLDAPSCQSWAEANTLDAVLGDSTFEEDAEDRIVDGEGWERIAGDTAAGTAGNLRIGYEGGALGTL